MSKSFSRRSFLRGGTAAAAALSSPLFPIHAAAETDPENSLFPPASPLRMTQYGSVKGKEENGQLCWYGVPYGAAPAGEARWTAPQEPDRWLFVRDCTSPAPAAYQYTSCPTGSEDCLTLDIYSVPGARKRPVLVYLHSGFAASSSLELPGNDLTAGTDCVFVSLNYRLGLFGWNCLPALLTAPNTTGNFALLDIIRALDWLKENIHHFGGDPANITLCGFSDGGRMVTALLGSEPARGRFQKAIAISGGLALSDPDASAQKLAGMFAPLAVEDGLFGDAISAARWLLTTEPSVREWLCSLEPSRIAALSAPPSTSPVLYADGTALPKGNIQSPVPLLLLSSATEFSTLVRNDLRPASEAAQTFAIKYGSAFCRWSSTKAIAEALAPGSAPVWLELLDYGGADSRSPIPGFGSFHGLPLALLSHESSYSACADLSSKGARCLSAQLMQTFSDLMHNGTPGWQSWTVQSRAALRLDADSEKCYSELSTYPDSKENIRADIAADVTLSESEKETVEHAFFSGFYFDV